MKTILKISTIAIAVSASFGAYATTTPQTQYEQLDHSHLTGSASSLIQDDIHDAIQKLKENIDTLDHNVKVVNSDATNANSLATNANSLATENQNNIQHNLSLINDNFFLLSDSIRDKYTDADSHKTVQELAKSTLAYEGTKAYADLHGGDYWEVNPAYNENTATTEAKFVKGTVDVNNSIDKKLEGITSDVTSAQSGVSDNVNAINNLTIASNDRFKIIEDKISAQTVNLKDIDIKAIQEIATADAKEAAAVAADAKATAGGAAAIADKANTQASDNSLQIAKVDSFARDNAKAIGDNKVFIDQAKKEFENKNTTQDGLIAKNSSDLNTFKQNTTEVVKNVISKQQLLENEGAKTKKELATFEKDSTQAIVGNTKTITALADKTDTAIKQTQHIANEANKTANNNTTAIAKVTNTANSNTSRLDAISDVTKEDVNTVRNASKAIHYNHNQIEFNKAKTISNTYEIANNRADINKNTQAIKDIRKNMETMSHRINGVEAMNMATSNLFQPYNVGKVNVSVGVGSYEDAHAVAIGAGARMNEHFAVRSSMSFEDTSDTVAFGVGASYEW